MSEGMGKKTQATERPLIGTPLHEVIEQLLERVEEAERRLDKQAKVIKGYRERVRALEQRKCGAGHGAPADDAGGEAVSESSDPGQPPAECLICGAGKEPGREVRLTCAGCGKAYQRRETADFAVCRSCGGEKNPGRALQCAKCSTAFRAWKTRA